MEPTRIGVLGHSMGGKLTTNLVGMDRRVRAAVPSCGGSGDLLESAATVPGGSRTKRTPLELACVSDNAYIPLLTCPVTSLDEPLFAFANVTYDAPAGYQSGARGDGRDSGGRFVLSSRVLSAGPAALEAAGVRATDQPDRRGGGAAC